MTYTLLVLWNIDLTLVDVARVTRAAYAEAFAKVAERPLVHLPQMAGRSESEVFFEALALNGADMSGAAEALVQPFSTELAAAMLARREDLRTQGQVLPGAADALKAVHQWDKAVQSVLTGTSRSNAMLKLVAFNLDQYIDFEVGGYGCEAYPKGTLVQVTKQRAGQKYGGDFDDVSTTVYIGDSPRDVEAARIGGARSVAVASGRATTAELREAGPDVVLPDLTDTQAVLAALTAPPAL
jgi:phosphoglycolate phosphatase-like HAD superfamily hydrolase